MSSFPHSPRLTRGGLVLLDPSSGAVKRVITLQYNPDSLSRTLQSQTSGEGGARAEALRLRGPAVETIRVEAELDATDQLEFPDQSRAAAELGLHPQIAALESLLYPTVSDLTSRHALSQSGTLEVAPLESPLALFVWSAQRVVPVRVTEFSIIEEAFDPALNPIRARVTLGLRVLSTDDVGFAHKGGALFIGYLQRKELMAAKAPAGTLDALGLGSIP
jgi:hypothetical protein